MMSFTGAVDVFVTANLVSQTALYNVSFFSENGGNVNSDLDIDVSVQGGYECLSHTKADFVFICGGLRSSIDVAPILKACLQKFARRGCYLGGIWNGSYTLAQAGLMDNYQCTVHPENYALMCEAFPEVTVSKKSFVFDRNRLSSAGATSTLSLMLQLVGQISGEDLMMRVAKILSVDSVVGETMFSCVPQHVTDPKLPKSLVNVIRLMETHIDEPLSAKQLAALANLSTRQIERLFQQYLDISPSRYYLHLRLDRARQLLRQSNAPVVNVAVACGFSSGTHFSYRFKAHFGMSPSEARKRRDQF